MDIREKLEEYGNEKFQYGNVAGTEWEFGTHEENADRLEKEIIAEVERLQEIENDLLNKQDELLKEGE